MIITYFLNYRKLIILLISLDNEENFNLKKYFIIIFKLKFLNLILVPKMESNKSELIYITYKLWS